MNEDFTAEEVCREISASIKEPIKEEKKKVPFIWLLKPLKKDIIKALQTSIYKDDLIDDITFWYGNNKYFVTDKGIVYSISTYKTNYNEEIDEDAFYDMYYTEYKSIAELEDARAKAKTEGKPFVCRQLRRLKPENRQLELKIKQPKLNTIMELGYKIKKKFNDSSCRYDYFVRISQAQLIDIVLNGKEVKPIKAGRKGKEFAILAKEIITVYKNKKDCYEKLFADVCSEKTFKRAIKDKDIGDTFVINGLSYEIADPSRAH